jgi:uncharacterized RDD family membrane protein YckC
MIKNSKILALKQAVAFSIDLMLVSLPFIVAPSIEIFPFFLLLWFLYIPLSEYYFSQTLGMNLVGTYIFASLDDKTHISLGTASRMQIARISIVWGVFGWVLMFLGKQYGGDYVISDGKNYSLETDEDALVVANQNNQYKVIFFASVLMLLLDFVQGRW